MKILFFNLIFFLIALTSPSYAEQSSLNDNCFKYIKVLAEHDKCLSSRRALKIEKAKIANSAEYFFGISKLKFYFFSTKILTSSSRQSMKMNTNVKYV